MSISIRGTKLWITILSILTLTAALLLMPINKAEASVSWDQEVTETAKKYIGVKYKWGGAAPSGFDSSGFTQYVLDTSAADIKLPRTSKDQYKIGKPVNRKDIKAGDLVFFKTNSKDISSAGIALSNNEFITVSPSKGVVIQSLSAKYWKERYVGAKYVLK